MSVREMIEQELGYQVEDRDQFFEFHGAPVLVAAERVIERLVAERDREQEERIKADKRYLEMRSERDRCAAAHVAVDAEREKLRLRVEELEQEIMAAASYQAVNAMMKEVCSPDQRERYRDRLDRMVAAMRNQDHSGDARLWVQLAAKQIAAIDAEVGKR